MKKGSILILLTALFFSTMEVSMKLLGGALEAFQMNFLRFAIGGIFLIPFAIMDMRKKKIRLIPGDYLYLGGLGVLCICISMLAFQLAVTKTNANMVAVIMCTNPVFTMVFAHFMLGDKMTKKRGVVLAISMVGLVVIANPIKLMQSNDWAGILYAVAASVTFALYGVIGKKRIGRLGGMVQTSFSFLFGCVAMLVILLVLKKPIVAGISMDNILLVLYLGAVVTGIGYFCYFKAIDLCGPSNASIAFFLKPMFAPVIAFFVLGEEITLNIVIGIVLILTGSYLNMERPKKIEAPQQTVSPQ